MFIYSLFIYLLLFIYYFLLLFESPICYIFALLGFVSSMALAKFLVHGEIIDGEVIEKEQDLRQEKILKECVQEMEN